MLLLSCPRFWGEAGRQRLPGRVEAPFSLTRRDLVTSNIAVIKLRLDGSHVSRQRRQRCQRGKAQPRRKHARRCVYAGLLNLGGTDHSGSAQNQAPFGMGPTAFLAEGHVGRSLFCKEGRIRRRRSLFYILKTDGIGARHRRFFLSRPPAERRSP
jgi:hypothetical protein